MKVHSNDIRAKGIKIYNHFSATCCDLYVDC